MEEESREILEKFTKIDSVLCCLCPISYAWRIFQLPRLRRSISTRFGYVILLFMTTLICMFILSSMSWKFFTNHICSRIGFKFCEMLHGPAPVYRIYFGMFLYFLIGGILMLGVRKSDSIRGFLFNRIWSIKCFLLLFVVTMFLLVPRSPYTGEVWHFFGLNAAFAYIVLQFILLLDAVHTVNLKIVTWIEHLESTNTARHYFLLLWLPTSFFYTLSILVVVNFYKLYSSQTDCVANLFFISFHVYMCASASFISIHPVIQAAKPKSGLLQSSVVSAYSSYTLWLTLSNEPDEVCNPTREYLYPADPLRNTQIIFTILITFFILGVFCIRIVESPQYGKGKNRTNSFRQNKEDKTSGNNKAEDEGGGGFQMIFEDEEKRVEYSYSFFMFILCLSSLYLMMSVTNWYRPEEEENFTVKLMAGWGAVWIKLCGGIFCVFLYIWSMVAPVIFPTSYRELCFYDSIFATST